MHGTHSSWRWPGAGSASSRTTVAATAARSRPSTATTIDHVSDDRADLIEWLGIDEAMVVGHSMGGSEVALGVGRHGPGRARKAVLASAVTPSILATAQNPGGVPLAAFHAMREGVRGNRSQFDRDFAALFSSYDRPGRAPPPAGLVDDF